MKKRKFALPSPLNGSTYSLREALQLFRKTDMSCREFYDLANSEARHKIVCSLSTFDRDSKYMNEGILPQVLERRITRGRPKLISDNNIVKLNNNLKDHMGKT